MLLYKRHQDKVQVERARPPCFAVAGALKNVSVAIMLASSQQLLALGLGELSFSSQLGEPLVGEIKLIGAAGLSPREVVVRQLTNEQARALGIELLSGYQALRIRPALKGDRLYIKLGSAGDINEPFVNIVVELRWPSGKVFREYTLLLDLPPEAPQSVHSSAITADNVDARLNQRARAESLTSASASTRRRSPPADTALDPSAAEYRIRSGDSLSKIADRLRAGTGNSRRETMDWLQANNPDAFIRGDINHIKAGSTLQLPVDANLAMTTVQPVSTVGVTAAASQAAPSQPVVEQTERLTVSRLNGDKELDRSKMTIKQLESQIDASRELSDSLSRENTEMRTRIARIESSDYVDSLERLLELREQQINLLKADMAARGQSQAADTEVDGVEGVESELSGQAPEDIKNTTAASLQRDSNAFTTEFWLGLIAVLLSLFGGLLFWLSRRSSDRTVGAESLTVVPPAAINTSSDDVHALDELDNILDLQGQQESLPLRPEGDGLADESIELAPPKAKKLAKPGKLRDGWRPDEEVASDIRAKMASYHPPEEDDNGVRHHDETEEVIAEALNYAEKGSFDTADTLLVAHRESGGPSYRVDKAMQYVAKKRREEGV